MQDYVNQATANWLDLLPVQPVYPHNASWVIRSAVVDLDILKATDVYFVMTVLDGVTTVDISVFNDSTHCFSFQQATVQTDQLFDTLVSYGSSIPAAIKQFFG